MNSGKSNVKPQGLFVDKKTLLFFVNFHGAKFIICLSSYMHKIHADVNANRWNCTHKVIYQAWMSLQNLQLHVQIDTTGRQELIRFVWIHMWLLSLWQNGKLWEYVDLPNAAGVLTRTNVTWFFFSQAIDLFKLITELQGVSCKMMNIFI